MKCTDGDKAGSVAAARLAWILGDAATGTPILTYWRSAGFPVCLWTADRYQTMREMAASVCF